MQAEGEEQHELPAISYTLLSPSHRVTLPQGRAHGVAAVTTAETVQWARSPVLHSLLPVCTPTLP